LRVEDGVRVGLGLGLGLGLGARTSPALRSASERLPCRKASRTAAKLL